MLVIGLTGGIGTGKSEASRILTEFGAIVVDADRVGHEAYRPRSQAWREVVDAFGEGILLPNGEIDRKSLGTVVFSDPKARTTLNSIMHPRMTDMIRERIEGLRTGGVEVVVVEAALLMEAGWDSLVDEVWVTCSPEEQVFERLQRRNGLTGEEIRDRIGSQLPLEERVRHADVLVMNSGNVDELREELESLWSARVKGKVR